MTKLTNAQNAMTHVQAYVFEIIQYERDIDCYFSEEFEKLVEAEVAQIKARNCHYFSSDLAYAEIVENSIKNAKTISQVKSLLAGAFKEHYANRIVPRVDAFYKAMLKTVPSLEYKDHGGTECRGWWRVFDEITGTENYFCSFDLGRDMMMAIKLRDAGAITKQQYLNHITKRTLAMFRSEMFQTDGQPDAVKVLEYVKPEYRTSDFFDMRFINAIDLKEAA
jgi:hypothetical protein